MRKILNAFDNLRVICCTVRAPTVARGQRVVLLQLLLGCFPTILLGCFPSRFLPTGWSRLSTCYSVRSPIPAFAEYSDLRFACGTKPLCPDRAHASDISPVAPVFLGTRTQLFPCWS